MTLQARDVYEEAIQTVTTVRDFTQVFDAYAQFEELSLTKRMEEVAENPDPSEEGKKMLFFCIAFCLLSKMLKILTLLH
jgi:hypothetical protein